MDVMHFKSIAKAKLLYYRQETTQNSLTYVRKYVCMCLHA